MRTLLACLLATLLLAAPAYAGGSPETTLVVVNEDSPLSKQIANHYVRLRGIPASHVCRVSGIPNLTVITLAQFRERIWEPIRAYLDQHGLWEEIDLVALSGDFPYGVDYREDIDPSQAPWNAPPYRSHVASITSLIYLHRNMADHAYLSLTANKYARNRDFDPRTAHGFRSRYAWSTAPTPDREPPEDSPDRYLLCVMLGATGIQGNSTPEVLRCLDRSAGADGTRPEGSVYLMENTNVRATTRMPMFAALEQQLDKLVPKAVRLKQGEAGQDGKLPVQKDDVIGCVAGIASCNWLASKSTMLPGALVEHLTSFGARLDGSGQTKCTEFIRHGAAGTSGTVTEPYAIPHKFPLPFMHGYYAEGASMAEAFYQSLMGPYQLLILGEPLARPYARFGEVAIASPDPETPWSGTVEVTAKAKMPEGLAASEIELFVDGQLVARGTAGDALALDTTTLDDGVHDVRLVVVDDSLVETRSVARASIEVKNGEHDDVTLKLPKRAPALGEPLEIKGKARGAKTVELLAGTRSLGTAKVRSSRFKLELPTADLGVGTTEIVARAVYREGPAVRSAPASVDVALPAPLEQAKPKRSSRRKKKDEPAPGGNPKPGLAGVATTADGKDHAFRANVLGRQGKQGFLQQLREKAKGKLQSIRLTGEVRAPEAGEDPGFYRLAINAAGKLTIRIRGEVVFEGEGLAFDRQAYAALRLEAGWHPIEIEYEPSGNGDLHVMLGGDTVSAFLGDKTTRQ